jgi:hypothetical protein
MGSARRFFLLAALLGPALSVLAATPQLGEAPSAPTPEQVAWVRQQRGPEVLGPTSPFTVDTRRREEVRNCFNTVYAASEDFAIGWTGDLSTCTAGTTDAAFRDRVALRINYFRAMAGLPANIVFSDVNNAKNQQAALMMSANSNLSHHPPTNWICYTADGAEAAGNSNLSLGDAGPDAITAYIEDFGDNNRATGHRRWLLYPQTETMGTGDIPEAPDQSRWSANAVWVWDGHYGGLRPPTRDGFVAWPPPGFVPHPVVFPRWSFALPGADLTNAVVTVSSNGVAVPVTVEPITENGSEPTLVWFPTGMDPSQPGAWPTPAADTAYTVRLENVVIGGKTSNFTYTVTVFDPAVPGPDTVLPAIAGPDAPAVDQSNTYSFPSVPGATGYQWRAWQRAPFVEPEGAENGLAHFTADTSPGYNVVVADAYHSGSHAFHLAHPRPPQTQRLTYTPILLPGAAPHLQFWSRLGYAMGDEVAKVELAADGTSYWQTIFQQAGTGVQNDPGETAFNLRTVPLAAWAGRIVQIRFSYEFSSGRFYPQTDSTVGWVFDDLSFTDTDELTGPVIDSVPAGTRFVFTPSQTGGYALDVRAQMYGQYYLDWGPIKPVDAVVVAVPSVRFTSAPSVSGNQVQIDFEVSHYRPDLTFELLTTPTLPGAWSADSAATFQPLVAGSSFRATTSNAGRARAFYRLSVN